MSARQGTTLPALDGPADLAPPPPGGIRAALRRPWWRLARLTRRRAAARLRALGLVRRAPGPVRCRRPEGEVLFPFGKPLETGAPAREIRIPHSALAVALVRAGGVGLPFSWQRLSGAHGAVALRLRSCDRAAPATTVVKFLEMADADDAREVRLYTSPLLRELPPACQRPRCYGSWRTEGITALFLEDLGPVSGLAASAYTWSPTAYRTAAWGLAHLGGAYLEAPALREPWLRPTHTPTQARRWLVHEDWQRGVLPDTTLWRRIQRCCAGTEALLRAFAALPPTLCHHDAQPSNIVLGRGRRVLSLLDWELTGPGPLGDDLAPLVWGSWSCSSPRALAARERWVLEAYLDALAELGLSVDAPLRQSVRLAYLVSTAAGYLAALAGGGPAAVVEMVLRRWEEACALAR